MLSPRVLSFNPQWGRGEGSARGGSSPPPGLSITVSGNTHSSRHPIPGPFHFPATGEPNMSSDLGLWEGKTVLLSSRPEKGRRKIVSKLLDSHPWPRATLSWGLHEEHVIFLCSSPTWLPPCTSRPHFLQISSCLQKSTAICASAQHSGSEDKLRARTRRVKPWPLSCWVTWDKFITSLCLCFLLPSKKEEYPRAADDEPS